MCEAMSSGLIPITIANTAIPEFLPDKRLLCKNTDEMLLLIKRLFDNPEEFAELSAICSTFINAKCSADVTSSFELNIISKLTN